MINVGVLGATGAVGQRFVQLLANHPWFNLECVMASERSAGKEYRNAVNWRLDTPMPENIGSLKVKPVGVESSKGLDIVFSALPADLATTVERDIANAGVCVCSNASSHRMDKDVPLVIAEVNPEHLGLIEVQHDAGCDGCIVTNPNCSTIMLVSALNAIKHRNITDIKVATMQAISGAGFDGVAAMAIYDNVIPYIGSEEKKMETETLKIMGKFDGAEIVDAPMKVSASCNRVPVIDGHTLAVWTDAKGSVEEIINDFKNYRVPFSGLPTQPEKSVLYLDQEDRPQPRLDRNRGNGMTVSVGRVREGGRFIAMGHNTIRGAAGASVLNAELIVSRKLI